MSTLTPAAAAKCIIKSFTSGYLVSLDGSSQYAITDTYQDAVTAANQMAVASQSATCNTPGCIRTAHDAQCEHCLPCMRSRFEMAHARHQFNKRRTASSFREFYYRGHSNARYQRRVNIKYGYPGELTETTNTFAKAGKSDLNHSAWAYVAGFNTVTR